MNKWEETKTSPQMNVSLLDNEFGIDKKMVDTNTLVDVNTGEIFDMEKCLSDVDTLRKDLEAVSTNLVVPDEIISKNIDRANKFLDKIQEQIESGDLNARLFEVAGQLIMAVTAAATSITGISYNQQIIDNKNRALDIKEKEMKVKSIQGDIIKGAENVNITNNTLIMNREQLLEMLNK